MSDKEKSDFWVIRANVITEYKVVFEDEVTEEEAIERFKNDQWADIVDEEMQIIIDVVEAEIG